MEKSIGLIVLARRTHTTLKIYIFISNPNGKISNNKGNNMFESLVKQIKCIKDTKQREEVIEGFSVLLSLLHKDFDEERFVNDCKTIRKMK